MQGQGSQLHAERVPRRHLVRAQERMIDDPVGRVNGEQAGERDRPALSLAAPDEQEIVGEQVQRVALPRSARRNPNRS
jgi:hypothetical protein